MLDEKFIILAAGINFLGAISYLISTIKGKTKPNRVTWLLWSIAPMLAFSAQIKQHVGLISLTTFIAGFNPMMILLASFINKKSEWKIGKLDITCGILSLLGLILWQVTKVPNLAIIFAIMADGLAATPTIVKSYTNPETENAIAYFTAGISSIIAILTIKTWRFENFSFPLYLFSVTFILYVLIQFKIGKRIKEIFLTTAH